VSTHLDSLVLAPEGPDRVRISGATGSPPPETLKVCVNELGGFRNQAELVLVGLDVEEKAAWVRSQLTAALDAAPGGPPAVVEWSLARTDHVDADTEEGASTLLRCTVKDGSPDPVGRAFTSAAVELALASYPGFTMTAPPAAATPFGVYRAEYVDRADVAHTVVHADGGREVVADPGTYTPLGEAPGARPSPYPARADTLTRRLPLGTFVHARSGDKGGDANVGLWVAHDGVSSETYAARVQWLFKVLSPRGIPTLLPEAADLDVEVWLLPELGAANVVGHGLLGQGVAASTRFDPQAKGLGEWLRSRLVSIEESLL
jgi:hypothetical protein